MRSVRLLVIIGPSLFEVQSILYEGSSYSVHLGRCRHFESYGSALGRGFDMCTFVLKRLEFFCCWKNWKSASLLISYFRTRIVYVLYGKLLFTISLGKRFYFYRLCVFYLLVFSLHSLEPGICSAQIISGL